MCMHEEVLPRPQRGAGSRRSQRRFRVEPRGRRTQCRYLLGDGCGGDSGGGGGSGGRGRGGSSSTRDRGRSRRHDQVRRPLRHLGQVGRHLSRLVGLGRHLDGGGRGGGRGRQALALGVRHHGHRRPVVRLGHRQPVRRVAHHGRRLVLPAGRLRHSLLLVGGDRRGGDPPSGTTPVRHGRDNGLGHGPASGGYRCDRCGGALGDMGHARTTGDMGGLGHGGGWGRLGHRGDGLWRVRGRLGRGRRHGLHLGRLGGRLDDLGLGIALEAVALRVEHARVAGAEEAGPALLAGGQVAKGRRGVLVRRSQEEEAAPVRLHVGEPDRVADQVGHGGARRAAVLAEVEPAELRDVPHLVVEEHLLVLLRGEPELVGGRASLDLHGVPGGAQPCLPVVFYTDQVHPTQHGVSGVSTALPTHAGFALAGVYMVEGRAKVADGGGAAAGAFVLVLVIAVIGLEFGGF
mmetsp:Transcript_10275/g.15471  ORF Transcript_10275/g.15471 Transcript_10275/m.15471 type:complete len:460 (+) Transcript_10275:130-1509(+)